MNIIFVLTFREGY